MRHLFFRRVLAEEPALERLKNQYTFVDMHIHSNYSYDCKTPLSLILKKAQKENFGIAITDHLNAKGAIKAAKQKKVMVIPGVEVCTKETKEILLYFYSTKELEEFFVKYLKHDMNVKPETANSIFNKIGAVRVKSSMQEILDYADKYSCFKSVPHPFAYPPKRSHRLFSKNNMLSQVDAIEAFNGAIMHRMNKLAARWAMKKMKPLTAGSDAHQLSDIGDAMVACHSKNIEHFLESIRKKENFILGHETKFSRQIKEFKDSQKYRRKFGLRLFEGKLEEE